MGKKNKILVSVVMGSDSDLITMQESVKILKKFNIPYEVTITSAHRSPELTDRYIHGLKSRGIEVVIAGAGGAAHLPGVIAAKVNIPVIGVPMETKSLSGIDSLYSILQMPKGVPVATMAIGAAGAANAAILAVEILALKYPGIKNNLDKFKKELRSDVKKKSIKLNRIGYEKYLWLLTKKPE